MQVWGFGYWMLQLTGFFRHYLFIEHLLWEITVEAAGEFTEAQKTLIHRVTPSFNYSHYFSEILLWYSTSDQSPKYWNWRVTLNAQLLSTSIFYLNLQKKPVRMKNIPFLLSTAFKTIRIARCCSFSLLTRLRWWSFWNNYLHITCSLFTADLPLSCCCFPWGIQMRLVIQEEQPGDTEIVTLCHCE